MPVSFRVATHKATPYPFPNGRDGCTAEEALAIACEDQHTKAGEVLQFWLPGGSDQEGSGRDMDSKLENVVPNKNGFVATVLDAYTQDRALVIRPDDVWLAVLCQFSFFVNARAELLRANFVSHEGKAELVLTVSPATRYTADFGEVARQMAGLVEKNVVDPELRAWATPAFTTTTENDRTVSAVLLLATVKQYFDYTVRLLGCGIPRVTLEGEKSDWVNILGRIEKLKDYGLETIAWYHLLRPVITRFVVAFEDPKKRANVDFWQRVAHYEPGGSGFGNHYTGWITAFTVFSKEGRWIGNGLEETSALEAAPETVDATQFWAAYGGRYVQRDLVLDGAPYHRLNREGIPPGYGEVDILLIDNGEHFECAMVAGHVGTQVSSSGDAAVSAGGADDTVRPIVGWWLFVKDEIKMKELQRAEEALRQQYEARSRAPRTNRKR
ncbi:hypothetical protein K438DRAFT_1726871 [Mycena galopus ATCC 62051]|nr:hypothetical protein K438DRAFT_1726871 [Mycena galopus ATCC 62051]